MGLLGTIIRFIERIITLIFGRDGEKLYGLDHAILNVEVPLRSMWMNMGYWKNTNSFPEACEALLEQVLITAGLVESENEDEDRKQQHQQAIKLLDVGIGCGDQSLYLTDRNGEMRKSRLVVDSYIGVTLAKSQADFARDRLLKYSSISIDDTTDVNVTSRRRGTPEINIFAANAADPSSWTSELKKVVLRNDDGDTRPETPTWLLALDTMYHYSPSRKPLLRYAYHDMQASMMAFDLLISETASFKDKLVLQVMCLLAGIPYSNFITKRQYEDMLVEVGYERDMIEMRDISDDVFAGIARYLRNKDKELSKYGMGLGKFKGPAKAFDWWARSGMVRGFVVVARR